MLSVHKIKRHREDDPHCVANQNGILHSLRPFAANEVHPGKVLADDPAAEPDIRSWAKRAGQKILKIEKTSEGMRFLIRKEN